MKNEMIFLNDLLENEYTEYLYNIYDEEVKVSENEITGETICYFQDGIIKSYNNYDRAITRLKKMGYIF